MPSKSDYLAIYTDGGVYEKMSLVKWAYIIVENNEDIIESASGRLEYSGGFDVERAESEAIYRAVEYCYNHPNNYRIYTDSRSILDKIENKVNNNTRNPHIPGIKMYIKKINESQLPESIQIKYLKRRSNKWSQEVDDRCFRNYYEQVLKNKNS
jgi:ribonuclease HI